MADDFDAAYDAEMASRKAAPKADDFEAQYAKEMDFRKHTKGIQGGAIDALRKLSAAAKLAGFDIKFGGDLSGKRSTSQQKTLFDQLQAGERTAPVAAPGTSKHESGYAIDLPMAHDPEYAAWLIKNAPLFGFSAPVKNEPWHHEWQPPELLIDENKP